MKLIKTSLLNGIAVIVKMLTLLGINKVLAFYVGPAGYAALGQFQNAMQMITTFAGGAINTGITKYTAEHFEDEEYQHSIWRTGSAIALIGSLIATVLIIIFNRSLASWFLKDETLGSVFIWFAATLVLFVFNTLLLAILNGKNDIQRYVIANIAGSLFALVIITTMVMKLGLYGALISLAIYQSLAFFVTLLVIYRAKWFKLRYLIGGVDKKIAKNLAKYTLMAFVSAACVPISHIFIRNHLGESLSWTHAGYWEALWRLSGAYLMLITTTLSVYYLPKLSSIKAVAELKKEVFQAYKLILPLAFFLSVFVYFFRDPIIKILFSSDFLPMRDLFLLQLVGDFFKIGSLILSYIMLSKAMFKLYITTEILFSASFCLFTVLFMKYMPLQGVVLAYALNYAIYWVVMIIFIYYWTVKSNNSEVASD